jgi:hypothetical protein
MVLRSKYLTSFEAHRCVEVGMLLGMHVVMECGAEERSR